MEWLILMMVAVPLLAFGAGATYWASGQVRRNRLLGGDPEIARLAAAAERAVSRLKSSAGSAGVPPTIASEVHAQVTHLADRVLPELIERRRHLRERLAGLDVAAIRASSQEFEGRLATVADPEERRLLQTNLALAHERLAGIGQLESDLAKIDLSIRALVSQIEAIEERFAASVSRAPGAVPLENAALLLEELKQVQEEIRKLGDGTANLLLTGEAPEVEGRKDPRLQKSRLDG